MTWSLECRKRFGGPGSSERGSITVAGTIFTIGFLMVASLVYFQGVKLRAAREAGNIAEEAARAGAAQLDRHRAYTSGTAAIDPATAVARTRAYLTATGVPGTVHLSGTRTVTVTVTITKSAAGLDLIGVNSISATRTASADLVPGLQGPDS